MNSVSWKVIRESLKKRGISGYLRKIVDSYLQDRSVTDQNGKEHRMTAGVPQGSVLGPTLWNLAYDDVLRLKFTDGVHAIAYADDLALLVAAKDIQEIEEKTNWALEDISGWMREHGLELAPEKSEAIMLLTTTRDQRPKLLVDGQPIEFKEAVKYLGVILEKDRRAKGQIRRSTLKASEAATNIAKILPRTYGALEGQRRLLAIVAESIALYGSPAWGSQALKYKYNKEALEKCQRVMGIRMTRCYRTVFTKAILVLARTIPWPHVIRQRTELYRMNRTTAPPDNDEVEPSAKTGEKIIEETFEAWQKEWDTSKKGRQTHSCIPDVKKWHNRKHGELSYFLTQTLTGHGNFNSYLHRVRRVDSPECKLCDDGKEDDAHRIIIECEAYRHLRGKWRNMTIPIIVNEMMESSQAWEEYRKIIEKIMKRKEQQERNRAVQRTE